jgi:hypothetical protein
MKRADSAKKSPEKHFGQSDDFQEFVRTEILRRSINDVRHRAAELASPKKYEKVKSKVAGNFESQKQAKKRNNRIAVLKAKDELYTQQLLSSHRFIGANGEYYVFEEDFQNQKSPDNRSDGRSIE